MLEIDAESATPPYEQLRLQIIRDIDSGALVVGTRLPPVRRLADELGIAPGTVARAYRELEQDGRLVTRGRAGTFVAAVDETEHRGAEAAQQFAARMRELGIPTPDALALARAALGE